ncbi:TPA: L-seryl-tRNA(Sec) selenium transferase [Yersinia enterocolitica]|uniref:L-seryl-tRNA(Sec) selenium transferase n=1 Tax=Yersinia enterocolitica TaxID=630 RepID=UPI00094BB3F1|nr:L-seryl-tRNA(Sec) selenium transferase [Yersinia enterocolitica]HDL8055116.1 L-seryl-tRNA(Sec) selenium transferase [Yersinia enterocolitica]HDM8437309.1 L-seryl-tRNA(Sec) selenium transferase [Yersinia enterocolitica]HEI6852011.1 L-seryl-tRNA(Sec) selenium transferase [Yersinia enterocolitica]HEN3565661.1 L-seryl-tRNA(Sec) selenium transferase [Yersinia enterocolitica]HEN3570550.1 L-seryl-tRNA(Sec) selenium transferase [Yersinia enterocolitica]
MSAEPHHLYSQLPAIDSLLRAPEMAPLLDEYGAALLTENLRLMQAEAREYIRQFHTLADWCADWPAALRHRLNQRQPALKPVFNLSGTVLHTNLGRAPLAESAIAAVTDAMRGAVTLEYSLSGAGRGHRDRAVADLLCELTGAEDACIVNNNAAAVFLMLTVMATGKQVVVSRGELVEIGGAFRIPDVMRQAGCELVEVGTTNRTHLKDYRQAISEHTGLLMKVHTSNYSIEGFTASVAEQQLAALGHEFVIPTATDLGSGSLVDMTRYGLPAEPMPQQLIAAGVDLVTFSGDKLLGGPQAGIILGKKRWIDQLQQHPLKRVLRADKMTLAALDATLRLYQQPDRLTELLPTMRLLTRPAQDIAESAQRVLAALNSSYGAEFTLAVEACWSQIGSGSLPVDRLPSWAVTFTPKEGRGSALEALTARWRGLAKPIIGRVADGRLWLDLRCLEDEAALLRELAP